MTRALGSARLGSARLGSARLGSARLGSANYTFCGIVIYKRVQEHCLTTPWLPAGLPPRRSRAMHALPGRLDRSREAIGAGRGREERPGRGSPLGLRPLEAERPVVREPRREADRVGTLPVARRSGHVLDLPRPRAALGQGHEFAYPMYPSRHFRTVREYQYIALLIQFFGLKCRSSADERSGCVYRTDGNGPIASMGPRTDPTGPGRTPPEAGQWPGRGLVPVDSWPGSQAPAACGAPEQDRAHDMDVARP